MSSNYELEMTIKEGTYLSACPSSNRSSSVYVETSIDGVVLDSDRTDLLKLDNGHVTWNKRISKTFSTLEPATPVMISLSMYKKRFLQQGFKLVGTAHFSISELIPILNKDTVQGRIKLNVKKNSPCTSSFLLALKLKSSSPPPLTSPIKSAPFSVLDSYISDKEEYMETNQEKAAKFGEKTAISQPYSVFDVLAHIKVMLFIFMIAQVVSVTVKMIGDH